MNNFAQDWLEYLSNPNSLTWDTFKYMEIYNYFEQFKGDK